MPVTYGNQSLLSVPNNAQRTCPLSLNSKWINLIEAGGGTVHNSGTHTVNPVTGVTSSLFNFLDVAGATYLFVRTQHQGGTAGTSAVVQLFGFDGTGTSANYFSLVNSNDLTDITMSRTLSDDFDGSRFYTIPTTGYQFDLKGAVGVLACVMTKFDTGTAAHTSSWVLQAKAI